MEHRCPYRLQRRWPTGHQWAVRFCIHRYDELMKSEKEMRWNIPQALLHPTALVFVIQACATLLPALPTLSSSNLPFLSTREAWADMLGGTLILFFYCVCTTSLQEVNNHVTKPYLFLCLFHSCPLLSSSFVRFFLIQLLFKKITLVKRKRRNISIWSIKH